MGNSPVSSEVPYLLNNEIWKKIKKIQCLVGVEEETDQNSISIYPNPHSELFLIDIPKTSDVKIFNEIGQEIKVLNNALGKVEISSQGWESGLYLIKIKQGIV